jgi:hypothetical protein
MEQEQGKIKVNIGGISRAGSESKTNDGLCNEIINLEFAEESLKAYKHKELEFYGKGIKKMFIHKTSVQKNIVYVSEGNKLRFLKYPENGNYVFHETQGGNGIYIKTNEGYKLLKDEKIATLAVGKSLDVDLFYNMFSFRDGTWYMFRNGEYESNYKLDNLRINLAFDIKPKGIAIARRYFQNTRYMMCGEDEFYQPSPDNRYFVACKMAKNMNGLFNMIDSYIDKSNGMYRIDGICYLRYGVRVGDGYSFISDPILIASPDVKKSFKKQKTEYKDAKYNYNGDVSTTSHLAPMPIFGGMGATNDDDKESGVETAHNKTSLADGFYRITHVNALDYLGAGRSGAHGEGAGGDDPTYIFCQGELGQTSPKETSNTKDVFGKLRDYTATIGNVVNGYDGSGKDNMSCQLFDKVCKIDADGRDIFKEAEPNTNYSDNQFPHAEYAWALTGTSQTVDNSKRSTNSSMYACKEYGHLNARLIGSISSEFKALMKQGMIQQVDVFITNPISPVLPVVEEDGESYRDISTNKSVDDHKGTSQCNCGRIRKSKEEIEAEMANMTFFKLFSMKLSDLEELEGNSWVDINNKILTSPKSLIGSKEAQRLTMSGNATFENYKVGYVYNTQLHIAKGERKISYELYNINTHASTTEDKNKGSLFIYYDVEDNGVTYHFMQQYGLGNGKYKNPICLQHPNVSKIAVWRKDPTGVWYQIKNYETGLKKDTGLTYINFYPDNIGDYEDGIIPVYPHVESGGESGKDHSSYNKYVPTITLPQKENVMQVMLPEDPLVADREYRIGNGEIISICANTVALSAGQYGEYPIFVFTTEGIYTLRLNNDSLTYSNIQPLSREICNNPNSICQVDNGVFFSSDKGLMVVQGTDVACVSDVVKGSPKPTNNKVKENATANVSLVELGGDISDVDFVEYLKDCHIVYLYKKNKLLITNKNKDYSYLYSIVGGIFTKLSTAYDYSIPFYPNDLLVDVNEQNESHIYEFPIEMEDEYVDTMVETRAIKLGTEDIKSSYRVVLRGLFLTEGNDKHLGIYVFGSLDCENWAYIGGKEVSCRHKTIRNIGCQVERMGAKYLRVLFVGNIGKGSKIDSLEISAMRKYSNKIR